MKTEKLTRQRPLCMTNSHNLKLITVFLFLPFLLACNSERREKANETKVNALKSIVPKQDSTIHFDHVIFVDSSEIYYLDKVQVSSQDLAEKLWDFKKTKSNLKIQLKVDKSVTIDKLLVIMNVCREENIELRLKSE